MSERDREQLRAIKTFPQLVKYLRDELDWPIEADDFDDLTFDYDPEELGIDPETAAKIDEIKQLRPLVTYQPWGIFFVSFEPKRLPVVVLRRILSQLVVKKRASARKSEQASWNLHDLLFVSNYGEGDQRQITFAHFTQDENRGDLPTLRVLGWDDADTVLHIDHVHRELKEKLHWPEDESDLKSWRERWSSAFTLRHREVITTSQGLAIRLADLAKRIRRRANQVLTIETEKGALRKLHKAFQEALIHDLTEDDFADMYAQTIAYGLLAARVSRPMGIVADNLADMVPITNPFLKEMLGTFLTAGGRKGKMDFDELGIQEVVELLNNPDTHMEAVLRDFGNRTRGEDPVIHFYEFFLAAYDKKKKIKRGVFYTPQSVVAYIVRSVHELLQAEFCLDDGLADITTWGEMIKCNPDIKIPDGLSPDEPFVQILDPAVGTGTFLVEAIDVIHKTMTTKWLKQGHMPIEIPNLWDEYVPKHLLPRLYGFELLMAPYAIAHMKLGLKLYETGYRFGSAERANTYLTNSLEPATDAAPQRAFEELSPALSHETKAVNAVKHNKLFAVIFGNPPYSIQSQNLTETARARVNAYRFVGGDPIVEKGALQFEKNIQDDYVKFIRLAQCSIDKTGCGIVAYITNHGYVDSPTFRGMRASLLQSFNAIYILDLHGSSIKKQRCPDGSKDENVFDIQQGVAIGIFSKYPQRIKRDGLYKHADLWGTRDVHEPCNHRSSFLSGKYQWLLCNTTVTTKWEIFVPRSPFYMFFPQDILLLHEYEPWWKISDVMSQSGAGVVTARDHVVIDHTSDGLLKRAAIFRDAQCSNEMLCDQLDMPLKKGWDITRARRSIKGEKNLENFIRNICYRPFDCRMIFYHPSLIWGMSWPTMRHMLAGENIGISISRSVRGAPWRDALVTRHIIEFGFMATRPGNSAPLFPLYLYAETSRSDLFTNKMQVGVKLRRYCNFKKEFIITLASRLKVKFIDVGEGDLQRTIGPDAIFNYIYATLYSPCYRNRYSEFIKTDFPRLPLTSSLDLFRELARLGGELVALHLVEAPAQQALCPRYDRAAKAWRYEVAKGQRLPVTLFFNGPEKPVVGKVGWSDDTIWIDAVKPKKGTADTKVTGTVGFRGVPEEVWNFHIGGYQVCDKWLKYRKDRALTADDIAHYHRIVIALHETIRLMREIDEVIDAHGGWPNAFITSRQEHQEHC